MADETGVAIGGFSEQPKNAQTEVYSAGLKHVGNVQKEIGVGEEAPRGIIYKTIVYSFMIGGGFTALSFITAWANKECLVVDAVVKFWQLFVPIITAALGYLFGQQAK